MKKIAVALAVVTGSGLAWAGCSQSTPAVLVRSLERSGRAAFVCVRNPVAAVPGQELDACFVPGDAPGQFDYSRGPHMIALVTQTARGEIAMIDVTAGTVIDVDKSAPGYNFLPIGATPSDVVATPGGNASFVGIGDPTRPGIFALPTATLPLRSDSKPPTFGNWPACALPPGGSPSEILIVPDNRRSASDPGGRRAHCDGSPAEAIQPGVTDLAPETELFGRAKLAVLLPELGELDIIDAQDLLAREPGSFDPCPIERRVFLTVDPYLPPITPVPDAGPPDATGDARDADDGAVSTPEGGVDDAGGSADSGGSVDAAGDGRVCSSRANPNAPASTKPHPFALALADDGRLFISDDSGSVIHVVDAADPCTAEEKAPLLPSSLADPHRAVVTGAIAVSPLTTYGKQFVYAVDVKNNGSLMVFDVTPGSTNRRPLERRDRPYNPFDPPDRIALSAPVESLTFATHEIPLALPDPVTGISPRGVPCDPTVASDPNRPPDDYVSAGAGPRRLRGTFAFLALSNGELSVVDLDDFDAPCRRPRYTNDKLLGCEPTPAIPGATGLPSASQEVTCNIVEPHRVRSANFFTNVEKAGRHGPAMLTFPVLYDKDGTALTSDSTRPATANLPKLLGPKFVPEEHQPESWPLLATVSSSAASPENGLFSKPEDATVNWVAFDLRAPRAHITQVWTVTYEGALPWFSSRRGRLQCAAEDRSAVDCETGADPSHLDLYDSTVGFCDGGAQGADLAPPGASGDILEIIDDMPDSADPYWSTVAGTCSRTDCEQVFGTIDAPRVLDGETPVGRDIVIAKSYQGRLSLQSTNAYKIVNGPSGSVAVQVPISCCFPYPVAYTIRAGRQWIVSGQVTGFTHRIIPDPDNASNPINQACVESCDENLALRNGRLVARPKGASVPTYDEMEAEDVDKRPDRASLFRNAQMRFMIWDTEEECAAPPCAARVRDRFFSFQEAGGFVPMRFALSSSSLVMPQSVRFVRGIQMLAIPDPVAQGLMLFSLNRLATTASFY